MTVHNTISAAEFTKLWLNPKLTRKEAATLAGFAYAHSATKRARAMGLPDRPKDPSGRTRAVPADKEQLLIDMWNAGVPGKEIAKYFRVTPTAIYNTCLRLNLPRRPSGNTYPRALPKLTAEAFLSGRGIQLPSIKIQDAMTLHACMDRSSDDERHEELKDLLLQGAKQINELEARLSKLQKALGHANHGGWIE